MCRFKEKGGCDGLCLSHQTSDTRDCSPLMSMADAIFNGRCRHCLKAVSFSSDLIHCTPKLTALAGHAHEVVSAEQCNYQYHVSGWVSKSLSSLR